MWRRSRGRKFRPTGGQNNAGGGFLEAVALGERVGGDWGVSKRNPHPGPL